ncbi:MAG TPA: hypothetical protein VFE33_25485 [Thermoanaerobaculia bacterium]|nr:hypothetical protein [Thermoanaerobaculia bacterium]
MPSGEDSTDRATEGRPPLAGTDPSPSPPGANEKKPEKPDILNSTSIHKLDAWQAQFASIIFNVLGSRERGTRAKLAKKDFKTFDLDGIEAESLVFEKDGMEAMASVLTRRRLLVLAGEPKIGKRSLAVALTYRLWVQERLVAMLLLRQSPARDMQVNLLSLFDDLESRDQLLIFPDVFDGGNAELRRFFTGLTEGRLDEITSLLQERRTFLVLTSDYERLGEEIGHRLKGLHVLHEVQPLSWDLLEAGFHKKIKSKRSSFELQPGLVAKIDEMLESSATSSEIVRTLKTMPKIADFVDQWLLLVAEEKIELGQALRRASSLEAWLLFDLPKSFEEWSFTLALVLCHASRLTPSCSWLQFDLVKRELVRFLRRDLRRGLKSAERADTQALSLDEALCRAARAEVRQAGSPGACTIGFRDERHAEEIWGVLFGAGRQLLSLLHAFCEQQVLSAHSLVAEVAARALGRMGEIDPRGIVVRWMRELHTLVDEEQRASRLGALFQGILASQDASYRDECLWYLQLQLGSSAPAEASTAIQSLLWIGLLDADHADLALETLRCVAKQRLTTQLKNVYRIEAKLHSIEPWLQVIRDHPDDFRRTAAEEGLIAAFLLLFPEESQLSTLLAVEQTWVRLGLANGPSWFLSALLSWMRSSEPLLRPLTVLLFLRWGGIADTLESIRVPFPAETEARTFATADFTWLLAGLYTSQEAEYAEALGGFLEELFDSLLSSSFPSLMKQEFKPRLRRLLKSWAKQGLGPPRSRDATLRLFRRIYDRKSKFSTELYSWVRGSDFAKDSELADLRSLAFEVE